MAEAFVLLLAAGVMLAVAVPNPRDVTLNWLRLGGIIALALAGLSGYFVWRRGGWTGNWTLLRTAIVAALILAQLAFVQVAFRSSGRTLAIAASLAGIAAVVRGWPALTARSPVAAYASASGIAAMTGSVLMDMLLGHAYLTASRMTMRPFRRINAWLIAVIVLRIGCAAGLTLLIQWRNPMASLWPVHGLLVVTRWAVGLAVPLIFVLMAHECIRRRATQSATGILYVAGVLIFIGELLGLYLARETGLPF